MKPFMNTEQIEILAEYPEWLPGSRCIIGITNIGRVLGTKNLSTIYDYINNKNLPVYIAPYRRHRYIPVCELLQWFDLYGGQKTYQLSQQVRKKYSQRMKNNKIASKKYAQTDNVYIREK